MASEIETIVLKSFFPYIEGKRVGFSEALRMFYNIYEGEEMYYARKIYHPDHFKEVFRSK